MLKHSAGLRWLSRVSMSGECWSWETEPWDRSAATAAPARVLSSVYPPCSLPGLRPGPWDAGPAAKDRGSCGQALRAQCPGLRLWSKCGLGLHPGLLGNGPQTTPFLSAPSHRADLQSPSSLPTHQKHSRPLPGGPWRNPTAWPFLEPVWADVEDPL